MKVKICGQTSLSDCDMSVRLGADFLGVVLDVEWSARSLTVEQAKPIFERHSGRTFLLVFNREAGEGLVEAVETLEPFALQLTGQETPETAASIKSATGRPVYKSIHLKPSGEGEDDAAAVLETMKRYAGAGVDGFILDTAAGGMYGGTGRKSDWSVAAKITERATLPVFLAGGINPENAVEAARVPGIYGIDMASGVEKSKGVKSEEKVHALFENLRKNGLIARN